MSYTVDRIKCRECKLNTADFELETWNYQGEVSISPWCPACGSSDVFEILSRKLYVWFNDTYSTLAYGPDLDELWTESAFLGPDEVIQMDKGKFPEGWEMIGEL